MITQFSFVVLWGFFVVLLSVLIDSCGALTHYVPQSLSAMKYHQTSNISRTLVGKKIVDHSDVVGASPVGAAPTTCSFLT